MSRCTCLVGVFSFDHHNHFPMSTDFNVLSSMCWVFDLNLMIVSPCCSNQKEHCLILNDRRRRGRRGRRDLRTQTSDLPLSQWSWRPICFENIAAWTELPSGFGIHCRTLKKRCLLLKLAMESTMWFGHAAQQSIYKFMQREGLCIIIIHKFTCRYTTTSMSLFSSENKPVKSLPLLKIAMA